MNPCTAGLKPASTAFPDEPPARPPETLLAFYVHFVRPVWPAFALLLVAGFLGSVIEVALLAFVGSLVDMMRGAQSPEHFFAEHGTDPAVDGVRRADRPAGRSRPRTS